MRRRFKDKQTALKLHARQQNGTISAREREQLDSYVQADNLLSILKARALLALRKAGEVP